MKNINQSILNIFFASAIVFLIVLQFKKDDKIAYINSSALLEKYEGMKKAKSELTDQTGEWQKKVDTLSFELQEGIKSYEKKLNNMSAKEQQKSREELGRKQEEFLRYQELMKEKKDQEDQRVIGEVLKEISGFLTEYGKKNNYRVILAGSTGAVAYAEGSIDITDEVVTELNKKYSEK